MSNFEIIIMTFGAVTIVIELVKLVIYLLDVFSTRK